MIVFGGENKECGSNAPFLVSMKDGQGSADNELRILVAMAHVGKKGECDWDMGNEKLKQLLEKANPITMDENEMYEIVFSNYIMYQSRNESYCSMDEYEIKKGNYFVLFQQSRLLDYVGQATDCCELDDGTYYPGEWKHYGVYTQNHMIDIIADCEPVVRKRKDHISK